MKKDKSKNMTNTTGNKTYYYFPVNSKYVFFNNDRLLDILEIVDSELKLQEDYKYEFTYILDHPAIDYSKLHDEEVKRLNEKVSKMYLDKGLPEHLITVNDGENYYEISSGNKIEVDPLYFVKAFEKSEDWVADKIKNDNDYFLRIANFFDRYKEEKKAKTKIKF